MSVEIELIGRVFKPFRVRETRVGDLIQFTVGVGYKDGERFGTTYFFCTAFPEQSEMVKEVLNSRDYPQVVRVSGRQNIVPAKEGGDKVLVKVVVGSISAVESNPNHKKQDSQEPADGYLMTNIGAGRLTRDKAQENPPVPSDIDDNELPF